MLTKKIIQNAIYRLMNYLGLSILYSLTLNYLWLNHYLYLPKVLAKLAVMSVHALHTGRKWVSVSFMPSGLISFMPSGLFSFMPSCAGGMTTTRSQGTAAPGGYKDPASPRLTPVSIVRAVLTKKRPPGTYPEGLVFERRRLPTLPHCIAVPSA